MSPQAPAKAIETVEELLSTAQLAHIQFYEVSGRRFDGYDDPRNHDESQEDRDYARVGLMQRLDGDTLAVRSRMEVWSEEGVLAADVAAFFQAPVPLVVPDELARAFAERVANPIIRPYLREAISSTAVRLGIPVPLLAPLDHNGEEVRPATD